MPRPAGFLAALLLVSVVSTHAVAQSVAVVRMREGIAAYNDLDFSAAARLCERALDSAVVAQLTPQQRDRARMYLGAAQLLGRRPTAALETFRVLVLAAPRFAPDTVVFPPRVTGTFNEVRQTTKAVMIETPPRSTFLVGRGAFAATIWASSPHDISVALLSSGGTIIRRLYDGPISDSVPLSWDGTDAKGAAVTSGRYILQVRSRIEKRVLRARWLPLDVAANGLPPLPRPTRPDSALLPTRTSAAASAAILVPSLALGAVLIAPAAVGEAHPVGLRISLGTALIGAGIVGFALTRPRPIPANVAHNAAVTAEWRRRAAHVREENARRARETRLDVVPGVPELIEGDRQ